LDDSMKSKFRELKSIEPEPDQTQGLSSFPEPFKEDWVSNPKPKDPKLSMILVCAHQIRSPLASIQTALNAIHQGYVPGVSGKAMEMIGSLEKKAEQLLNFVNDLLNFGRLKSIEIEKEKEILSMENILSPILEEFRERAEKRHLQFKVEIAKPLPLVFGHSDGLRHLFYNLLDNAFQYTPEGGEVKFFLGLDPTGKAICGEISDTGIGIPSECLPYIFDEFYRAPNVKKRGIEGSGLGLNIVQWVIQSHQGEIKVRSEEGKGSSFWFAFPLGKVMARKQEEEK